MRGRSRMYRKRLGYKLTRTGISPVNAKSQGISERLRPTNSKQLRSFLGAVSQFNKFIPNLAAISFPFRSILKRDAEWTWISDHETVFKRINEDMTYAYGQIPLHELTKKHCNFQIVGGKSTGTYRFITGYYGLTVMPTDFQKVMDITLANINSVFVYTDDILIVTKGSKQQHMNKVREVLKILDNANLQLKAAKCVVAQECIE